MRAGDAADLLFDTLRWGPTAPAPMTWRAVRVRGLDRLVAHEGCAIWLAQRLAELGARPPEPFCGWLDRRTKFDLARNLMVDGEMERILALLTDRGVPHVFLKGAAWRMRTGSYAGARPRHDVDVLVPERRAGEVWEALVARGYARVLPEGHGFVIEHHLPALLAPGGVSVELHTATSHHGTAVESWNAVWPGAVAVQFAGRATHVPTMTEMLWQALEHAVHDRTEGFRLRRWLDAAVALRSGEPIDWELVAARLRTDAITDAPAGRAWLGAASQVAGVAVPREATGSVPPFDVRRALHWGLAVLSRRSPQSRVAIPLLEEGARGALGWPLSPGAPGRSRYVRARHRLAAAAARTCWRCWIALRTG